MTWRLSCLLILVATASHGCERAKPTGGSEGGPVSSTPAPPQIAVAMASDLRFVMPELEREFHQQHPATIIVPTFGSSGNLYAQISNHAPFDVFLSADIQYPQKLAEHDLTQPDSLFHYAVGHIVLWVRKDSPLELEKRGVEVLNDPSVRKVAIANPKLAPYGRAAEAALKTLNVYDAIQDKLVLGENISQTAQFAETGAADVAVIAMSIAVAPNFAGKGRFWAFPSDAYPRLKQGGVIMKSTKQAAAASEFCDFLQSKPAQTIFTKYGFGLPEAE